MSDSQLPGLTPGGGSVRHRVPASTRAASRLVAPLTAVGAVVTVIVLLVFLNGRAPQSPTAGPTVAPSAAPRSAVPPTRVAPRLASPPPGAGSGSPGGVSPGLARGSGAVPLARPRRTTTRPAVGKLPVTVLNNSRISGLGHAAAREVARRGWPIAYIGNLTGRIRTTTIYYAPGQYAVARAFARQFSEVHRVLPRFSGLPGHGLTLVVTRYWPH